MGWIAAHPGESCTMGNGKENGILAYYQDAGNLSAIQYDSRAVGFVPSAELVAQAKAAVKRVINTKAPKRQPESTPHAYAASAGNVGDPTSNNKGSMRLSGQNHKDRAKNHKNKPVVSASYKAAQAVYRAKPTFKIANAAYRATPRCKEIMRAFRATAEYKISELARYASPVYKATRALYRATPAYKALRAFYRTSPVYKAAQAKYRTTPAYKAAQAKYRATPEYKAAKAKYGTKYRATPVYKAAQAKYRTTPAYKALYRAALLAKKAAHLAANRGKIEYTFDAQTISQHG